MSSALLHFAVILAAGAVIYFTGKRFATASSHIGDYFRIPRSVKGATFDAISSSFPELMVAIFSVIVFKKFEVGIGTIAGSAMFNLLVITGLCVLAAPTIFQIGKEVIYRDGIFCAAAVLTLLAAILFSATWTILIPIVFLLIYAIYLATLLDHTRHFRRHTRHKKRKNISIKIEAFWGLSTMVAIAVAAYYLTEHSIQFAEALHMPPILIAFTVVAAATSVPDTVISVVNARRGHLSDATSNVFGSNIFDILVGLSVPILLAIFFIESPVIITFNQLEIVLGLLAATLLVLFLIWRNKHVLRKWHACLLLGLYGSFIAYVIYLSRISYGTV